MADAYPAPASFEIVQDTLQAEWQEEHADPVTTPAPAAPADDAGQLGNPEIAGASSLDQGFAGDPLFESFSTTLTAAGVPAEHLSSAHGWLQSLPDLGDLSAQKIEHGYSVREWQDALSEQDLPILTSFLNHVSAAGWDQQDVNQALQWYSDWSEGNAQGEIVDAREALENDKFIELQDKLDRDRARDVLRENWQEEADANLALVNQHLDRLPASQRQFYESADETGTLRLNRPDILTRLAQEARQTIPASLSEAARQYGSERIALEQMMANRSSPYWRGPDAVALQARYRDLISSGDTEKPLPQGASGIHAEIASIEKVMREDRHRYIKDEAMQQRYRELLELRG